MKTSMHGLEIAIGQAEESFSSGGVPIGSCLLDENGVDVASGHNERVQNGDPIAHAEMACLRNAGRRRSYKGLTLVTTLSPCVMCTGAILLYGIGRVVVGEAETFAGDLGALRARGVEVTLIDDPRCKKLMNDFKAKFPDIWNEDIGLDM